MKNFLHTAYKILFILLILLSTSVAHAAPGVPDIISYQGRLTDSNGILLGGTGTPYYFKFSIWDSPTVGGGTRLWPIGAPGAIQLTVVDGVFDANIGDTANGYPDALTYDFQSNDTVYLQVEVSPTGSGYETLGPRPRITSSSTAINAKTLSGLPSSYFLDANNLTNFDSRTLAAPLTGYTSGAGVITAADTVLSAIQKLNGNMGGGGAVTSVFGRTGVVTAQSGDYTTDEVTEASNLYYTQARFDTAFGLKSTTNLSEGSNLYYTDARARDAISVASSPLTYDNVTGVIGIDQADGATDGFLSSADWNTFNDKQDAIATGTTAQYIRGNGTLATFPTAVSSFTNDAGYITANQSITLSGAVTGSGTTAISTTLANGVVGIANLSATGTPSSSTYLRGDNTWAAISGGTVTSVSVTPANGFTGSVANATTTPAITIATNVTGLIKGDGTAISAASAGTDYSVGTAALGTGILKSTTGTGTLSIATAGDFPTLNQNTTGSAATLTTARTINGVSFNGSADITVTAAAGTLTGSTLNSSVTTSSLTSVGVIAVGAWQGSPIADAYIASAATWNAKENALTFSGPLSRSVNTISIQNAAADGMTKGAATFTAADFDASSGLISIDYTNGQSASGSTKGFLTASDWTTFNGKQGALTLTTTGSSGAATLIGTTLNIPQYSGGSSYTFSTGLTDTSSTITNNLSTGVSGGQSVIGGTGAGDNLTLSTTSNGTKGKIILGSLSAYDETNNRLGIGTTSPAHPIDVVTSSLDTGIVLTGNINSFFQANITNSSSGGSASSDWVATANNGSSTTHYIDMGINGSGGGAAPFTTANHAYLYSIDDTLNIGALGASSQVRIYTTGGTSPVQRAVFDENGRLGITQTAPSAKLHINTNNLGITQADSAGILLENAQAATSGLQQYSPALALSTFSWTTASGGSSQNSKIRIDNAPIQKATTTVAANFRVQQSNNGGAYADLFSVGGTTAGGTGINMAIQGSNIFSNAGGVNTFISNGGIGFSSSGLISMANMTNAGIWTFTPSNNAATSGTINSWSHTATFAPTSGTGVFNQFVLAPTINQTGGANGVTRGLYINPTVTSAADFRAIEVASSSMGSGVAGPVVLIGRNSNATPGAGSINLLSNAGTNGYVWQDAAGNLRIHTAAPSNANDTAGTVVGAQTSTRETKQDIADYTDYGSALSMIVNAPLHTFRYIKEVQGYGTDSPLAKTRIGFIADEVDSAFMVGNVIDQVSINGLLMASIKELDLHAQAIPVLEDKSLTSKIADFLRGIAQSSIAIVDRIKTQRVQTQELCIGDDSDQVCVTKEQLRTLLGQQSMNTSIVQPETSVQPQTPTDETPQDPPHQAPLATSDPSSIEEPIEPVAEAPAVSESLSVVEPSTPIPSETTNEQ